MWCLYTGAYHHGVGDARPDAAHGVADRSRRSRAPGAGPAVCATHDLRGAAWCSGRRRLARHLPLFRVLWLLRHIRRAKRVSGHVRCVRRGLGEIRALAVVPRPPDAGAAGRPARIGSVLRRDVVEDYRRCDAGDMRLLQPPRPLQGARRAEVVPDLVRPLSAVRGECEGKAALGVAAFWLGERWGSVRARRASCRAAADDLPALDSCVQCMLFF
mmetsp:Transcript_100014/g.288771  ORF Transcript_100014/g.288771 Transcript_100014/m.288771 type:complete len:215 (-) Transcript_100014:417-1061(-)